MNTLKYVRRGLAVAAMAAVVGGFAAAPADASPVPPTATSALAGTWVNVNSHTRSVKQVVIARTRIGSVSVDAFGACTPTLCEWGRVGAIVYGPNVSSKVGAVFQSRQRFLSGRTEWSRTTLTGRVVRTRLGLRLVLRELTVFEDHSGRKNYAVNEVFKRGEGRRVTRNGFSVPGYALGAPPAILAGMLGLWKNANSGGALAGIRITGTVGAPVVTAFGRCTPTPCNWGPRRGVTYGRSISSVRGATVLAPYAFGFKKSQLIIDYSIVNKKPRLTVAEFNEFTDGSGRANYAITETLVRP